MEITQERKLQRLMSDTNSKLTARQLTFKADIQMALVKATRTQANEIERLVGVAGEPVKPKVTAS